MSVSISKNFSEAREDETKLDLTATSHERSHRQRLVEESLKVGKKMSKAKVVKPKKGGRGLDEQEFKKIYESK